MFQKYLCKLMSDESDVSVSGSQSTKKTKLRNNSQTQKKRQLRRATEVLDSDSSYSRYPDGFASNFKRSKNGANKFKEAQLIPEIFRPFIKRLSNVKHKILMTGSVEGYPRNILLLGEIHSAISLDTGVDEIIKGYLETVNENVDFMLEVSPQQLDLPIQIYPESSILNKIRSKLALYIPYKQVPPPHFPKARVHWIDTEFGWLTNNRDPFYKFLHCLNRVRELSNPEPYIKVIEDLLMKFGNLKENKMSSFLTYHGHGGAIKRRQPDTWHNWRDDMYDIFAASLEWCQKSPIKTFKNCLLQRNDDYFSMFNDVYGYLIMSPVNFLFCLHRFLMDVYTCCRMLKVDDPWYKNIIVYAGASHTQSCAQILQHYGFKAERILYKRTLKAIKTRRAHSKSEEGDSPLDKK